MKNLIDIRDLKKKEIDLILKTTDELYNKKTQDLKQKTLAMIFFKPSTRTRLSFEVAMEQLGGNAVYFSHRDSQLGRGETIADTLRTLSQYVDAVVFRVFSHENLVNSLNYSKIPVINGLSDLLHPCQALSDAYTIKEKLGKLKDIKLTFVGDGTSNVCHSLINIAKKTGIEMTISTPNKYAPKIKGKYKLETNPLKATKGADVIYTDTWVSMGQELKEKEKIQDLKPYQVDDKIMKTSKKAVFMHCLPAHRGQEVTNKVIDGKQSIVFKQAQNRLHVQKAILKLLTSP